MNHQQTRIRPAFSILSFIVARRSGVHDAIDYEDHDLVFRIGSTPVGAQKVGRLQVTLPSNWQASVARCYKLQANSLVGQYASYRYLVLFDPDKPQEATDLLFGPGKNIAAAELAHALTTQPMVENIRENRFTSESPVDFAMITVVEVPHMADAGAQKPPDIMSSEDALRLAAVVRKDIGQEGGMAFPNRHLDVVLIGGGVVGTASDGAVAARFALPAMMKHETVVPKCVIDWLDFVDATEVLNHLRRGLETTELGRTSIKGYIDRILAAHGEAEFEDRYLKPREASLAKRVEYTEFADELPRRLQANAFCGEISSYFERLDVEPALAALYFADAVTSRFTDAVKKFDVVQGRIKGRDERISEYLRDVVGWRVTQASNRLAERMETLTKWLLALAILTVLATLITDDSKKEFYSALKEFYNALKVFFDLS
ncbi:hypothetical protein [Bradyrhizobium sp.]|jgi:hypothetical protein|uniref:hypothetical protein n=1 Tax=Bradyrhizobium sp. TaxID=376 RepID=UPI003BEB7987